MRCNKESNEALLIKSVFSLGGKRLSMLLASWEFLYSHSNSFGILT